MAIELIVGPWWECLPAEFIGATYSLSTSY